MRPGVVPLSRPHKDRDLVKGVGGVGLGLGIEQQSQWRRVAQGSNGCLKGERVLGSLGDGGGGQDARVAVRAGGAGGHAPMRAPPRRAAANLEAMLVRSKPASGSRGDNGGGGGRRPPGNGYVRLPGVPVPGDGTFCPALGPFLCPSQPLPWP